ncbi:complexed with cef1p [Spiromyces aspiralis]|uniref:Complexed with cef1p n=1 Tax=Spiromyces aspiralis TaxID=68401 RepID=A0ACC1HUN0_9FUNG|nr:complexed with cef1p [Spiromyces aspiralis]
MTTAARPTFDPARGKNNEAPSLQVRARDLPGHKALKVRRPGQSAEVSPEELREELFRAEAKNSEKRLEELRNNESLIEEKRKFIKMAKQMEADDEAESESSASESGDEWSSSDDEETAELMKELERIKRERAEEKERQMLQQLQQQAEGEGDKSESGGLFASLRSNPLLGSTDFSVKRRWDDDVVFKNQAKDSNDKPKKRFVNDMLRSDFHRKFMQRYIH